MTYCAALKRQQGFSLLELSIVITVVAVVSTAGYMLGKPIIRSAETTSTNNRLDMIETALYAYWLANGRLPCPGDQTLTAATPTTYGFAAGHVAPNNPIGGCIGGSPAASFTTAINGDDVFEGAVPVKDLSLPEEFMYDSWDRKIAYSVWGNMTKPNAINDYGAQNNCGALRICNTTPGVTKSAAGVYTLISYGPDGHGGYLADGTRLATGSTNEDAQTNCHCDANAADTGYQGIYIQKYATENPANALDRFDDMVRYKERWQLQSVSDTYQPAGNLTCSSPAPGDACIPVGGGGSLATEGLRIDGVDPQDRSGYALAVGDINGDGIIDLIIGAPGYDPSATHYVYVVFGTTGGFPNPLPLSTLDGTNGFRFNPENTYYAGIEPLQSVAAGDVNGDGIADLVIGAPYTVAGGVQGSAYVIFGHTGAWVADMGMAVLDGTKGIRLNYPDAPPTPDVYAGQAVGAADMNGDGIADIIVNAPYQANSSFVVFGRSSWTRATYTLDNDATTGIINGIDGFAITKTSYVPGYAIAAGDVNGDGRSDLVLSSPDVNLSQGEIHVVFGHAAGVPWATPFDVSSLNGTNGFSITGINTGDFTGKSVAAGDFNGDGKADVIIGAPDAAPAGNILAGTVYVVFGHSNPWASSFLLSGLDGTNGVRFDDPVIKQGTGSSVAAGDINGDGKADIVMGSQFPNTPNSKAFIVFGKATWTEADHSLDAVGATHGVIDGTQGFQANDIVTKHSSVGAGDLNGDGKDDVMVGTSAAAPGGRLAAGWTYVYFGQAQASWPTPFELSDLCPVSNPDCN